MSENRRIKRFNKRNKIEPKNNDGSNRDKIIWVGIIIVIVLLTLFLLLLQFLNAFISI